MRSINDEADLTARAVIRNAALRLFGQHGHDAVTIREIATCAGVSPALVIHHFSSKEGLRAAVDEFAGHAFDAILEDLPPEHFAELLARGDAAGSMAEAFSRGVPQDSPLPAYLRRLLLSNDPAGSALFARWYAESRRLVDAMDAIGAATPSEDPAVRAAFLLVNDLAVVLLREAIAAAIGIDPLTPEGIERWAREATAVYTSGAFCAPGASRTE